MRKLMLLTMIAIWTGACDSGDSSIEGILNSAESDIAKRKIAEIAARCSAAASGEVELSVTYEAMKVATGTSDCNELAATMISAQEIDLASSSIKDLSPLVDMSHLSVVDVSGNRIEDLTPLANLRNLSSLDVSNNSLIDIEPLESLITLANLNASNNALTDVSPLSGLFNLLSLNLENNQLTDASPLKDLNNLVEFKFRDNVLGTSLEKTSANCPSGTEVADALSIFCTERNQVKTFIEYCNNYDNETRAVQTTLDVLKGPLTCSEAEAAILAETSLDLSNALTRSDPNDPTTTTVDPTAVRITDASPLASFNHLEDLNLNYHSVSDLEPISYLTNLKGLSMRGNGITDISAVSYLKELVVLDMAMNYVDDLSPLRVLDFLTGLVMNNNNISDIRPIIDLPLLTGIAFGYNNLTSAAEFSTMTQLFVLDVSYNSIPSFASLTTLVLMTSFGPDCTSVSISPDSSICPNAPTVRGDLAEACTRLISDAPVDATAETTMQMTCDGTKAFNNGTLRTRLSPLPD